MHRFRDVNWTLMMGVLFVGKVVKRSTLGDRSSAQDTTHRRDLLPLEVALLLRRRDVTVDAVGHDAVLARLGWQTSRAFDVPAAHGPVRASADQK
jgi:hypothetical protein